MRESVVASPVAARPAGLYLEAVAKKFGELRAIDQVTVGFSSRELIGLVGPNGAGKTTLFGLIDGHHRLDSGEIYLDGEPISGLNARQRSLAGISRTFQTARTFRNLTVAQNLLLARRIDPAVKRRWWRSTNATRRIEWAWLESIATDISLSQDLNREAGSLTQPERKRLDFGMALAREPKFLVLDEPTAGVGRDDMELISSILRDLRRARPELSIVISSHDVDLVLSLATRIVVLAGGRILAQGTPQEVMENAGVQEAYLGAKPQ